MKILLTTLICCVLSSFTTLVPNDPDFCLPINLIIKKFSSTPGSYDYIEDSDNYRPIPGFKKGFTRRLSSMDSHSCSFIVNEGDDLYAEFDKVILQLKACFKQKPKFENFNTYKRGSFYYKKMTILLVTDGKDLTLTFDSLY